MNMVPIGEIVDFIGGGTPSRDVHDYWNGDIPWASVKDFQGPLIDSTLESITLDGLSNSSSTLIAAGHAIMPTRMALGKAAINSIDVAINQVLKALKPKIQIDTRYLLHAVLSRSKEIQSHGKGATVQGITIERLRAIQIPLPPLEEQRRIAAILDKSDQLLSKSRLLTQAVPLVEQSIFESLFGEFANGDLAYPGKSLEEIVEDSRIGLARASNECGPELPCSYLKMDAIGKNGRLLLHKATKTSASPEELIHYSVQDGDVLFNTPNSRELVGKTAVYRGVDKMLFNNNLLRLRFRPGTVSPDFFRLSLGSRRGASELESRKSRTTSVCAIYWKNLKAMAIPLPPYELQLQLVTSLQSRERLAERYFQQEARRNDLAKVLKSDALVCAHLRP